MNQMIATRLGLDLETVEDILQMEVKIIHDNLKRGHIIEIQDLLTIMPKHRKPYRFTSGLDGRSYNVKAKYSVEVEMAEPMQEIIEQQSRFFSKSNNKKS